MHLVSILDSKENDLVLDMVRENNVSVIGSYFSRIVRDIAKNVFNYLYAVCNNVLIIEPHVCAPR